jgi:hypothetical protein
MASISIKGEGFARHPHPFGARPAGCAPRAASGVALDADSSQDTATAPTWTGTKNPARWPGRFGDGRELARSSHRHQSTDRQSSPLATTLCNLVAWPVTNAR